MNVFQTDKKYDSITEITRADLVDLHVKAICIDADNTSGYDGKPEPLPGVLEWVRTMQHAEVPVLLLSNAEPKRAQVFGDKLGIPVVGLAAKPFPHGYLMACLRLGLKPSQVLMVGDQLFTDILGANLLGMKTIYVKPYAKEERSKLSFGIRRALEQVVFRLEDRCKD